MALEQEITAIRSTLRDIQTALGYVIADANTKGRTLANIQAQLLAIEGGLTKATDAALIARIKQIQKTLKQSSDTLNAAIAAQPKGEKEMAGTPNALDAAIQGLSDQVTQSTTVDQSAVTLINGIAAEIAAAVAAAQAAGATPAELASITALQTQLQANAAALSAAVAANTPAAPSAP